MRHILELKIAQQGLPGDANSTVHRCPQSVEPEGSCLPFQLHFGEGSDISKRNMFTNEEVKNILAVTERGMKQKVLGVSLRDHINNRTFRKMSGVISFDFISFFSDNSAKQRDEEIIMKEMRDVIR